MVLIILNSVLVDSFSDTRILVPSDLTTRSSGEIRKANGRAMHSMIRKAMYVSGVTPPLTPLTWFLERLCYVSYDLKVFVSRHLLDSTSYQLSKVASDDPESQVLASRVGRCQGHDCATLGNVPGSCTNTSEEATKNQIPLVTKFAVAVVR